ncbi:MAG: arginine decarboxylase [Bacteroidia bacterium]|nr:arginine decarboxylase [Bacteroidia bacterium]
MEDKITCTIGGIEQSVQPIGNHLQWHGIDLFKLSEKHGSPLKLSYLPIIKDRIQLAKNLFAKAFAETDYSGSYEYCYCTKSNQLSFIVQEALRSGAHLETSSEYDIDIIISLCSKAVIDTKTYLIHNGTKSVTYLKKIKRLQELGFTNSIIVIDSIPEFARIKGIFPNSQRIGLRKATYDASFGCSRLGLSEVDIRTLVSQIKRDNRYSLEMLHFFVDSGMGDVSNYLRELDESLETYKYLQSHFSSLRFLNIGGGMPPLKQGFNQDDAGNFVFKIMNRIKEFCDANGINNPDIFTEFGSYTVAESGAVIFEVIEVKQTEDGNTWYILNNSLMTTIPDNYSIRTPFQVMAINNIGHEKIQVKIGGISCDQYDVLFGKEDHQIVLMPKIIGSNRLFVAIFNTGAYQDSLSGYGGIKHCLIQSPKHMVLNKDEKGKVNEYQFKAEQSSGEMLAILGY